MNVAKPELLNGLAKKTLASVEKVFAQNRLHDSYTEDVKGMFAIPPDGFYDKIVNSPGEIPPEMMGESKKGLFDKIENFLSPVAQIMRGIPESAEAFMRGFQFMPTSVEWRPSR